MASAIPENQAPFTLAEVVEITHGELVGGAADTRVDGVASDTRAVLEGKLFVALPGERFDGHSFVSAALRSGARALLVERDVGDVKAPVVRVASTYRALAELAAAHRRRWRGRLAAVAGSAGKTTTRAAVGAVLEAMAPGAVHQVAGNLNNRVGVPFVLLGLRPEHRVAVIEIGTNAPGEVAELTAIANPDVALLTLIGLEHTEGLGSIDAIEVEESAIYGRLAGSATAIGNVDDERVRRNLASAPSARRIGFGFGDAADYRVVERTTSGVFGSRVTVRRPSGADLQFETALVGRAGVYALSAAIAAGEACLGRPIQPREVARALELLGGGEPGRLTPVELPNGMIVLDDSYNANPASLESSVAAAAEIARANARRLVLVLGEMRELGDDSPRLHREAGKKLLDCGAAFVVGLAGDARWLIEPLVSGGIAGEFAEDVEVAQRLLAERTTSSDVVLVKASRGVRAERIVEGLKAAAGRSA